MKYSLETPFESPHGKLSKKNCKIVWGETYRGTRFTQVRRKRSTAPSTNEIGARTRFSAVAQMVRNRRMDLSKISQDQMAFLAQRNNPGGKKTMQAYYWYICGQEYDAQHPNG